MPSSIDKSRTALALFNKDWNIFKSNWQNASGGFKNKFVTLFKSNDINCLKEYNRQIQAGIKPSIAYKNCMMNCTKEAKQNAVAMAKGVKSYEQVSASIRGMTISAKAGRIALQALSTAGNMLAFMAITKFISSVISVVDEMANSTEKLKESASELGQNLSDTASSIYDYKKKIEDLYNTINSSSSSIKDVTQARTDLMVVQDELIEKFGTEKNVIEDITNAINGQIGALDNLSKKSYYEAKNKFNEKTTGDEIKDWLTYGSTDDNRVLSNMDKMVTQMTSGLYTLETTGNEVLDNLIAKIYNLNVYNDIYGDGKHFIISGELDEIQEKLYGIQELSKDFDVSTGFENSFTEISNGVNSLLQSYKDLYSQYVLYEKILNNNSNNQYDEQFNSINKAKEAFDKASKSGDEEAIQKASDNYAKVLSSAINLAMINNDYDVVDYFEDMYPEMQQLFGEWKFNLDFEPNTDGLKDKVSNLLITLDGFSSEDILSFNPNVATEDQVSAYGELNNVAEQYGLTLQQLINLLIQMGLVQSESYQNLVAKFGQDNVNKIAPEDLEIAYSISSEEADKALEQEKNKIKSELQSLSKEGNVDLTIRPVIDSSAMQAAGWNVEDGSIATTFTQGEFVWQGDEENGQYVYIHYTPILPDGTVLTPDELTDYLYGTLEGSQSVLDADNKGIVLKVDTDLNIPEGDIKKFTNGEGSTDAIDGLIQKTGEWDDKVHGVQEQYYDTGEGIGYASNALDGLIEKHKQLENSDEITVLPDISQTIDNLNTRLKPTMDALKEAYQDIFKSEDGKIKFSLDDVDISTSETIKSAIEELDKIEGIEIDYSTFDDFVKVLNNTSSTSDEVQAQFDKLSTSIVYSADCTQMTKDNFDLLVKSLYEMGLVNAEEVLTNIRNAQEELKESGINLTNVTAEEAEAFINEAEASDIAIQYLRMYMLQKELANDNQLDTTESIQSLKKLCEQLGMTCNALGKTSELMQAVLSLESATNAIAAGVDYSGQYARQAEDAKKKIEDIKNGNFEDYNYNFNSNVTSPSKSGKSSSKEDKQSKETIDFIEIAIKRIEEAIDKLKTKAENTFIGFEIRAKHYVSLLGKVTDEINLQSQAYQAYMARANSVGLSEVYASQVRDGSLNIVDITDDTLKEQIKDYQTWYEKAKECQDKVEELKITQIELTQANLELLITKYEKLAEKVSSANDRIQGKLDLKEAWGFHATSGSYTSMNKNIIKQIDYIKKQDEELKKLLNTVEKGSEAWLEYQARLDDNKKSLQDLTKEMAENAKAAAELSGAKAERKVEKYDKSDEKLDAKIDNSIKYKNQNKYLNTEMNNIDRRQKAYDKAVETDKKGIKSTSKAINKTKSNKENKSILKKIKSLVKQKKKIPESLLKQTSKLGDNNALYDKCVRYNAYISAYEIDKDIADLYRETSQQDKADIAQRKLDNIQTYYKNRQGENNQKAEQLNARIEMAKESGYVDSATLYNQLSSVEKQNNDYLRTERDRLQESLAKSLLDGSIKKNSDEWYEMCQQIDDVTNEIDQSDLALKQYQNTLRQMKWDSFDYLQGKISNVTSEMDFMINELSRKDLTSDDIGGLTDEGNGVAYLRASKYETLKNQLADYYAELETLEKTEDQYDTKVIERKEELRQRIQDTTSAVQDEKWAIIDLYTQGYEALSNKIKDLIDEYGELLDAEKEAYDWQNTIADKTKEIASIRKQLSAYANDSSEETKAKIQQLNVSLEEAEKDLKDSQYDKFISDTKDMLSDLQEDMDNNIQSIIDNLDKNFDELMASIGENATTSAETVKSAMTGIGYQPSEDFSTMLSTTLEGSSIKASVDKMTTSIDNLVEILKKRAEENAKGADTTTASEDVKKEAISEQQGKVDTKKEKYEEALEKYNKAKKETSRLKTKRDDIGWIYGVDSKRYKTADENFESAKTNRDALESEVEKAKKEYEDELAELEKLKKYSVGSKHITKDQLAWTQDGGQELVYRSNDGAILTRLGEGDKVFTNEMSENLWKLAQLHPADFMNGIGNVKLPDVTRNVTGGDVRIEFGDLVLPDVTNSAEFANSVEGVMRNAICKNGKTTKCFTEAVSSMQMGRGIGNARLYK